MRFSYIAAFAALPFLARASANIRSAKMPTIVAPGQPFRVTFKERVPYATRVVIVAAMVMAKDEPWVTFHNKTHVPHGPRFDPAGMEFVLPANIPAGHAGFMFMITEFTASPPISISTHFFVVPVDSFQSSEGVTSKLPQRHGEL